MRLLVQRVKHASVSVEEKNVASIENGLLVLVGFGGKDHARLPQSKLWSSMIDKLLHLRIFPGQSPETQHKFHLDVCDHGGKILLVSQFTLYAHCKQGRRPDFLQSTPPHIAEALFTQFVQDIDVHLPLRVSSGIFGANMDIQLCNWGPVTISLDSEELFPHLETSV